MRVGAPIRTLAAGDFFADAALTRVNRQMAAEPADEVVDLVRAARAQIDQLGLQLNQVIVAGVAHTHRCHNRLFPLNLLTALVLSHLRSVCVSHTFPFSLRFVFRFQ